MNLSFNYYNNLKFFRVEFESDSRQRNRIMTIEHEGFNLDIPDFIEMHHDLYIKIHAEMLQRSNAFWDEHEAIEKEIGEIPTLAYQKKVNDAFNIFKPLGKILFALLIFIPLFSLAQFNEPTHFGIFGAQAEYNAKYQKAGAGFFGGYRFYNNYIGLNTHILFGNQRNVPQAVALEYGYNIGNFQPYISYQYFTCGNEAVNMKEGSKGFDWGGGISYMPRSVPLKFSLGVNGVKNIEELQYAINYSYFSIGYYKNL